MICPKTTFDCISCETKCLLVEREIHADPFRRGKEMRTCNAEQETLGLAAPIFKCAKCGADTQLAAADPAETVCPDCCEDHEYGRNTDAGWPTCVHCNHFAPNDYHDESGLDCGTGEVC
ncbi:hypothetical protein LCGC14_0437910 [marine sediment metagenome]|uniref:Uncharacterized protein n=1 Tax=marine sediment metagenome TaxID=412755 RepID=A0A0F9V817_9ZZZZ